MCVCVCVCVCVCACIQCVSVCEFEGECVCEFKGRGVCVCVYVRAPAYICAAYMFVLPAALIVHTQVISLTVEATRLQGRGL